MSRKRKSSRARKSPRESIRKASESMSAASESHSEASDSLRAASESLRRASRSVDDADETFRAASGIRALTVRASWVLPPVVSRRALPLPSPTPALEGPAPVRAGKGRRPKNQGKGASKGPAKALVASGGRAKQQAGAGSTDTRRRGPGRLMVRGASWALIVLGVLALVDAGVTLVWQEPVTALYAMVQQDQLGSSLEKLEAAPPSQLVAERLALVHDRSARVALLAGELERQAGGGSAVGRLVIPRIGADYAVVKGTDTADLEEGPGVYSRSEYQQSMFPGLAGVTAIAGHRTTFLAPFRHIDELRKGDEISLTMPYARFIYTVQRTRIVAPNNVYAVLHPGGSTRLVLSSCNPPFSAAQRILVYAGLTRTTPLGAARAYERQQLTRSYPSSRLAGELSLPNSGLKAHI